MTVKEWLKKVAYVDDKYEVCGETCSVHRSRFDDSYITHVGELHEDVGIFRYLAEHGVTEELTHGVGFSPSENKWYGWSQRAIYGFEIGSTCEKGDCHYRASNLDDEKEKAARFWSDEHHDNVTVVETDTAGVLKVSWTYNYSTPNEDARGRIGGVEWHFDPKNYGRGEWTAETMEDAKQMAIDFNELVS